MRQPVIEWLDGLEEPREMLCAACNGCGQVAVNCALCGDTMRDEDGGPCWCAPSPVLGGLLILAPMWLGWAAVALTGCSGDAPLGSTPLVQLECHGAAPVVCHGNLWTDASGKWNCTRHQRGGRWPRTVWQQPDPQNVCHVAPSAIVPHE